MHSEWMNQFFFGSQNPLGEGFVITTYHDGRQFKLKHGGEDVGQVPKNVNAAVEAI